MTSQIFFYCQSTDLAEGMEAGKLTHRANPTPTIHKPDPTETPLATITAQPRELTICLGSEPDSLWLYGSNMLVKNTVLEAIYDGPIDALDYDFQPVILEKLPSLTDGDARIE